MVKTVVKSKGGTKKSPKNSSMSKDEGPSGDLEAGVADTSSAKRKVRTRKKSKKFSSSEDEGSSGDLENGEADTSTQNCCIYSVPKALVEVSDKKWFEPRVVSIGHYNCKNDAKHKRLQMIQKCKPEFLRILLNIKNNNMEELIKIIRQVLEADASSAHYSKKIKSEIKNDEFLEMLILDGCFIIELFRKLGKSRHEIKSDPPLADVAWAIPHFYGDLLLLENQIPFVVLKELFKISRMDDENYPLSFLALKFFNKVMRRSEGKLRDMSEDPNSFPSDLNNSIHLLDLVRKSFITPDLAQPPRGKGSEIVPVIYCIKKLRKAGIKIKPREADSFLNVTFKNGVIEMPKITLDYFMNCLVVNCRAFERLHKESSKHITVYAYFLDCLVNTAMDVEYLYERNIIDSYEVGENSKVVRFINKLGKEKDVGPDQFYLYNVFDNVDRHYKNKWNMQWTGFKHKYFNTPWTFISAAAAFVLLVLTFLQTYYTIKGYVSPK